MNQNEDNISFEIAEESMEKAFSHLSQDLLGQRSGKASPSLVDSISVEAYGGSSRLKDLAGVSAPEPRLLVVQPWDMSIIDDVLKAISKANIGVTPIQDGKIIRIPIPELSEERREELKKMTRKMGEETKISIRNIRREANEAIKKLHKSSEITEDQRRVDEKNIQQLTDDYIEKVDASISEKEKELENV